MDIQSLKSFSLFSNLNEDILKLIVEKLIPAQYNKYEAILFEGDTDRDLYLIKSGGVKVNQINFEGNEVVISNLGPGDFFGEMAIITAEERSANVVATEDTEIFKLPAKDFERTLSQYPDIAIALLKKTAQRLKESSRRINELSLHYAESRIAISLIKTAQKAGKKNQKRVILEGFPYKHDLAKLACTSTKIVDQTIENFKRQGIIAEKEDRLLIFDFDKLIADFS